MSTKRTTTNNHSSKKPYCKVCHDAGKPEKEYTSHCVKTTDIRTGTTHVTCPTLLHTECRYCFQLGHTAKFCTALAKKHCTKERTQERTKERTQEKPREKETPKNNRGGGFNALMEDDNEEDQKEEFPALGEPSKRVTNSYASAAAKPATSVPMTSTSMTNTSMTNTSMTPGFVTLRPGAHYEKTQVDKPVYQRIRGTWLEDDDDDDNDFQEGFLDNSAWD
jgi:hypothetical protein